MLIYDYSMVPQVYLGHSWTRSLSIYGFLLVFNSNIESLITIYMYVAYI